MPMYLVKGPIEEGSLFYHYVRFFIGPFRICVILPMQISVTSLGTYNLFENQFFQENVINWILLTRLTEYLKVKFIM